jgi:two-component system, OmpR family, sensor histidine kinase BaeS
MKMKTVRSIVLSGSVAAIATALFATFVATEQMLLSGSERNLMAIVLLGAFGLAVVVAQLMTRRLVRDLDRLATTAGRVAEGDLAARSGVQRLDEVGAVAQSFDDMAARLELSERRRTAEEAERRLLIASVGHDLRTPIAAIKAATEAIQDGVAPDPARYMAAIRRDVDHLGRLTDDLFMLAQLDAGRFEAGRDLVDVVELGDEAVEALLPAAAMRGVDLSLETDLAHARAGFVRGTAHDLGRVLRNLVDNAIRHAPTPGHVRLVVSTDGAHVVLRVLDDGPGFPAEFISRAVEPFARADDSRDRARGGAGLGLAIAKGLTDAHGGELRIAQGPGGDVAVYLPAAANLG